MSGHRNTAPNHRFRAARESTPSRWFPGRPLTRGELAQLVAEHLWALDGIESPIDAKHIAKIETGRIRYPRANYRRALRAVLGVADDADLGFAPSGGRRSANHLVAGSDEVGGPDAPSEALGLLCGPLELLLRPGPCGDAHAELAPLVLAVRRDARRLGELNRALCVVGHEHARPATADSDPATATGHRDLARLAAGVEATGRQLLADLAQLCQIAGLFWHEAGDPATAADHLMTGVRAAHSAGNAPFAAHLFSLLSGAQSAAARPPSQPTARDRPDRQRPPDAGAVEVASRWASQVIGHARLTMTAPHRRWPAPHEVRHLALAELPPAGALVA